jgi:hypothetical protein
LEKRDGKTYLRELKVAVEFTVAVAVQLGSMYSRFSVDSTTCTIERATFTVVESPPRTFDWLAFSVPPEIPFNKFTSLIA